MFKYMSRHDCYYTDTDSAILGSPLPEEELEHRVKKGIFLAPQTYRLVNEYGKQIIKHKGPADDPTNEFNLHQFTRSGIFCKFQMIKNLVY